MLDALESGEATPMTRKDWQDIEREGLKRAGAKKKVRTAR